MPDTKNPFPFYLPGNTVPKEGTVELVTDIRLESDCSLSVVKRTFRV